MTMTMTIQTSNQIDVTDLQYQASKKHLPNKESHWKFPAERDGWVAAHNAIRGEMQTIEDCLRYIQGRAIQQPHQSHPAMLKLQSWEIAALQTIFDAHSRFIHMHHTNEDEIVTPWLATRAKVPAKLTDDHEGIVKDLTNIQAKINGLKEGDGRDASMSALLRLWKPYAVNMLEHLQEEEDIGLPLLRAYFTPREYGRIVMKLAQREASDKLMTGCFVYHMGKERCRKEFMKDHDIPGFVWHLAFSRPLKKYKKEVISAVTALREGVEPVQVKQGGLLSCR